jgi:hypothetical protein
VAFSNFVPMIAETACMIKRGHGGSASKVTDADPSG